MSYGLGRRAAVDVVVRLGRIAGLLSGVSALAVAGAAMADTTTATDQDSAGVSNLSGVVVTAPRQEVQARQVQMNASNIVRVQAADTIIKYPDFNAAESLGRMPDISLSSDTGEGRFVQIRGIDANLDGATYGGVPLLNTNPGGTAAGGGGRAVEFDTIPQGAIDGIVVTLTGLPDHEAEGLGGSIELSPRTAVNINQPFADVTLGTGYEPLHAHGGPNDGEVAVGARFGFSDKGLIVGDGADEAPRTGFISNPTPFSFVLTASVREDRRAIDDLEESYENDGTSPANAVGEYDLRRYDYHRVRFGYGGEFDFKPNDNHTWYIRADIAGYTESVHKNFLLFTNMPDPSVSGTVFSTTTTPEITLTDERETHRNQIYRIGGKDIFGDLTIDYHGAYSRATFNVDHSIGAVFRGPGNVAIAYDNVSTPNFPIFTFPGGFNVNTASAYTLHSIKNSLDLDADHEWSGAANAYMPLHLFGGEDQVKVGFEVRFRGKDSNRSDEGFAAPPLSLAGLSFAPLTYYAGHYSNGPFINDLAVRSLINSGVAVSSGPIFNIGSFFNADENIYAGYAEYTGQWGPWGLLAGVRVEGTDARYGAFVFDVNGNPSFSNQTANYVNAFPTVQLKYEFSPTLIARATYSTGIARPGFEQNTASASVDNTTIPGEDLITRGNPHLQPTYGDNFDLDVEDYLPQGGIVEVGLFDKEFTNYIASRIERGVPDPLRETPTTPDVVTTFLNIPYGYARGLDADYHQKFAFLPQPFAGFGIEANVTLVDSRFLEYDAATSQTGKNEYGLLPGTSPITWNLAGFYEDYGLALRLAAQYVEHSLFGLGGDKTLDTIQDNRLTLDFTSSYQVTPRWSVYFNVKNLLNTPLRYYQGEPFLPIQREFYDVTYETGVRAHF